MDYTKEQLREFLDLLQIYRSEDAKKARRNISAIGFVIVAVYLLGVKLTKIKVFGVDVSESRENLVLLIAMVLVLYWLSIATVLSFRDRAIQKERRHQFDNDIGILKRLHAEYQDWDGVTKGQPSRVSGPEYSSKQAYDKYLLQMKRTRLARVSDYVFGVLEVIVPLVLGATALVLLTRNLIDLMLL
jgi:hypothetical protein